jgi:hypothetical protein
MLRRAGEAPSVFCQKVAVSTLRAFASDKHNDNARPSNPAIDAIAVTCLDLINLRSCIHD